MQLPVPQLTFNYSIILCQPLSRIIKILLAHIDYYVQTFSLPDPFRSGFFRRELLGGSAGFVSLVEKKEFYRRFVEAQTDPLQFLIEFQKSLQRPVYIVPLLMFVSKKPRRALPTPLSMILGPNDRPGRLRKLSTLLQSPGKVFVEMSTPINLKAYLSLPEIAKRSLEYQSLALRKDLLVQINRHRQSITGPILKSREELKESILTRERFQQFMNQYAEDLDKPIESIRKKADHYLEEIAANFNPSVLRVYSFLVKWIINSMFDGVVLNKEGLNKAKQMSLRGPLVLIPCHKSHIDYLILSYLLYHNNMPCPLIAAGKNLSFWPLGPLFRVGGAFFIRRTFKGAVLYSKVFSEYIYNLLEEGHIIEQFIEGGRSRTGKLLQPKLGLLSIIIDACKKGACADLIFVPIYVGYDRVLEESAYLHELGGGQKQKENVWQVIRARKFLSRRYGKIYVQINEPLPLKELLRQSNCTLESLNPKMHQAFCQELGNRIMHSISQAVVVTPHGLVASALLNCDRERIPAAQLTAIIDIFASFLASQKVHFSDTLNSDFNGAIQQVLDAFRQRKFIEAVLSESGMEDDDTAYLIPDNGRPNLDYYKNNCINYFIPAAFTAMSILSRDAFQFSAAELHPDVSFLQNFFQNEFTYDASNSPYYQVRKSIKALIDTNVLIPHKRLPDTYKIPSTGFRQLKHFANFLKPYLESYWIVLTYIRRGPADALTKKDQLKKITGLGNRMYKSKEIQNKEALSRVNYLNALQTYAARGIKDADDNGQIESYAALVYGYLERLQS
jgi:glycerol-3-phosphate O-acyltransferase